MASIDPSRSSADSKAVVITFHCWDDSLPVYILTSVNKWMPVRMEKREDASSNDSHHFEHTVVVWDDVNSIKYKFRIGDTCYLHDDTAPTGQSYFAAFTEETYSRCIEPDGFGGFNNSFPIPWTPVLLVSSESTPSNTSPGVETSSNGEGFDLTKVAEQSVTPLVIPEPVAPEKSDQLYVSENAALSQPETQLEQSKETAADSKLNVGSTTSTEPAPNGHLLAPAGKARELQGEEPSEHTPEVVVEVVEVDSSSIPLIADTDEGAGSATDSKYTKTEEPAIANDVTPAIPVSDTVVEGRQAVPVMVNDDTLAANADVAVVEDVVVEPVSITLTSIAL